jgi:hypothetical protein
MSKFICRSYFYKDDSPAETSVISKGVPNTVKNPKKGQPDIEIKTLDDAYMHYIPLDTLDGFSFLNWVITPVNK